MAKTKIPVELYFLRYAFPCAYLIKERNEISETEYNGLEKAAIRGTVSAKDRPRLEKIFKKGAFKHLGEMAEKEGKDKWDYSIIREYFRKRHNELIAHGEGIYEGLPKSLQYFHQVKEGVVVSKNEDKNVLKVDIGGKQIIAFDYFVPEAKVGDKITVHHAYAVEIL